MARGGAGEAGRAAVRGAIYICGSHGETSDVVVI